MFPKGSTPFQQEFNPCFHISDLAPNRLITTYVRFFHTLARGERAARQWGGGRRLLYLTDKTVNKQPEPIPCHQRIKAGGFMGYVK
jgi:hypothetical protein